MSGSAAPPLLSEFGSLWGLRIRAETPTDAEEFNISTFISLRPNSSGLSLWFACNFILWEKKALAKSCVEVRTLCPGVKCEGSRGHMLPGLSFYSNKPSGERRLKTSNIQKQQLQRATFPVFWGFWRSLIIFFCRPMEVYLLQSCEETDTPKLSDLFSKRIS